jgi:2-polyprenyl-3-methyl-5-hydroxy-6-metoxy-1,4-benzoquinol methylase
MKKHETTVTSSRAGGKELLAFYEAHQILPVRYHGSVDEHLDRRDALYRSLGLPVVALKGVRVLEVAAGTGQNSLHIASCGPASLDLVEPTATGRRAIEANYRAFDRPHTTPRLHACTLQEFEPDNPFDVVVCEGWLGSLPGDLDLIRKLVTFVTPGGVLVLTMILPSGLFANVMRKLFALRLLDPDRSIDEQTRLMVDVFRPHLATMPSMTRSYEDWVHDCIINPHFLNMALPLELLLQVVGTQLETLATFPRFDVDWRWFKELAGSARGFNNHVLATYRANVHNFIDHRRTFPPLSPDACAPLHRALADVHAAALAYQNQPSRIRDHDPRVADTLRQLSSDVDRLVPELSGPLDELRTVWAQAELRPEDVRDMKQFGQLFGRETVYISFTRPRP